MPEDVSNKNDGANTDAGKSQTSDTQSSASSSSQDAGQGQSDWWDSLNDATKKEVAAEAKKRGFKGAGALWESYKEANKKISSQGEAIRNAEKFEQDVAPILEAIWSDPDLLKTIQAKFNSNTPQKPQNTNKNDGDNKPVNTTDIETRKVVQGQVVAKFEAGKGLDKLDEESQKEVRKIIGSVMGRWVKPGQDIPLDKLEGYLQDAYDVALRRNKKLKDILESGSQGNANAAGEFSSSSSGGSHKSGEVRLTPEQEKVADRMPGGREAYVRGLKKLLGK